MRKGTTMQGFYAFNADGESYGGLNTFDVEQVLRLARNAKDAHRQRKPSGLNLPASYTPGDHTLPAETIVLRSFSRIHPLPPPSTYEKPTWKWQNVNTAVGRDHLWVRKWEVGELVAGRFPDSLAARIARFHLLDNVIAQGRVWRRDELRWADFKAEPSDDSSKVTVSISGLFSMRRNSREESETAYEGSLTGRLVYDSNLEKVEEFSLMADGTATGQKFARRGQPRVPYPLKIVFLYTEEPHDLRMVPHAAWTVNGYMNP